MQKNNTVELTQYDNLIWSVVHKLLEKTNDRYYYNGLEQDLFQEGYVGLLNAYEKYSKELDIQFSTFAYKYIYGYCLNYLKKEFNSLQCEDIDNSPTILNASYELDTYFQFNLIQELNDRLKITNKKLSKTEEDILINRLCKEYPLRKCAELSKCSVQKIINTVNKYKDLIKDILIK